MDDAAHRALVEVLQRLQLLLLEPVDFTKTDSETTLAKVRLLSAAATYFNVLAISEFGGRLGPVRQEGLVEHVVGAAFQTYRGEELHSSPHEKAAMLFRGVTQGHPFTDANKRTGFLLASYYLARMGYELRSDLPGREIVSFCRKVSAGEIRDIVTIAAALQNWTEPRSGDAMQP